MSQGEGGGAPTKYKPSYNKLAFNYCLLGAKDADLARFFNVAESTINKWKLEFPKFSESIRKAKDQADAMVANSLYKRATGYSHPDVDIKAYQGDVIKTRITKHYPPDTQAIQYWLNNRQPDRWRTKVTEESNATVTHRFEDMDDDELDRAIETEQASIPGTTPGKETPSES